MNGFDSLPVVDKTTFITHVTYGIGFVRRAL